MVERYRPKFVTQEDDSPCQWTNCWAAIGAWGVDGASGGAKTPSPTMFRKWCVKPNCAPGGLTDIMRGLMHAGLWNRRCKMMVDVPKELVRKRLVAPTGNLYLFETDFESWPEAVICQPNFNDREDAYHSAGVIAGQGKGDRRGKVQVEDPLCKTYKWVDVDAVIEAASIYNREHGERLGTLDYIVIVPPQV